MVRFDEKLGLLITTVEACRGRIDPEVLDGAQAVIDRADRRVSLSKDVTIIAIAGATGVGKSSVFNALTRTALAEVGVRRPLTEKPLAITFGDEDTSELLDWLGITRRHIAAGADLSGIVLLDLVDHDSVKTSHHEEVDRLLDVVDEFFWIVDPQKYADAAMHEHYLRRFAGHEQVMTFVLNQIDRLSQKQAKALRKDFLRILREDGLKDPTILSVSALTGDGIDALRTHMVDVAVAKKSMIRRLEADIVVQAQALSAQLAAKPVDYVGNDHLRLITDACMEVAGVDQIADAVLVNYSRRGRSATGLPWLAWLPRLKADPLKRLHLEIFRPRRKEIEPTELKRSSLVIHPVAKARIDIAMRAVGDEAGAKLPHTWRMALGRLVKERTTSLPDAVDQAVISTAVELGVKPRWWSVVRILQWILLAASLGGLVWLTVNFIMTAYLMVPGITGPHLAALPLPTWLLIGGVVLGIILGLLCRIGVNLGAKAAAQRARRRLRSALESVTSQIVIEPINEELRRHNDSLAAVQEIIA